MLYRIQTRLLSNQFPVKFNLMTDAEQKEEMRLLNVWLEIQGKWDGLKGPDRIHKRARHYFTKLGWKMFGLPYLAAIKNQGLTIKVVKIKNPKKSRIFYQDKYQVQLFH